MNKLKIFAVSLIIAAVFLTVEVRAATMVACGGYSTAKRITIENPTTVPTSCSYQIRPYSSKVCQLRIDFKEFTLSQPTLIPYPTCITDFFTGGTLRLCGANPNQHFYIVQNTTTPINLNFYTTSRIANPTLVAPKWNFEVTQLECPVGSPGRKRRDIYDFVELQGSSPISIQPASAVVYAPDSFLIAPVGCLQYFPDATGVFESFNFQNGLGPYPSDMKYSICFKRTERTSRIQFNSNFFKIGYTGADVNSFDEACYSAIELTGRQEDFLFLPYANLFLDDIVIRATRFCGEILENRNAEIAPPGPFVIGFSSDMVYNATTEKGFRISYAVL